MNKNSYFSLGFFSLILFYFFVANQNVFSEPQNTKPLNRRQYDSLARSMYSENDVKAFVYKWFAGFDHQLEDSYFLKHLPEEELDMYFPDTPIQNLEDFKN